jgi:hypothetical protein
MREIFKRVDESDEILIEVDVEAGGFKEDYKNLFSVFIKFNGLDDNSEAYEEFLETKESLILAIEYEQKAKYLGSRVVDGWSEFYFCASLSKELNQVVTSILKDCGYVYESNVVSDTKWNFYETQLFPTELELAHIQSAKIIFLLQEEEENLTIKRDVEHYISFDTPTQKNRFLNTLDIEGFSFKDEISSEEFDNGIALVKNHSVTEEEVKKVVNELFVKVKKDQGYYEGWSTTLVNEENNYEKDVCSSRGN